MNEHCPVCRLKFERESGYFLGSMVFGYFLSALSVVPTVVWFVFGLGSPISAVIVIASLQIILLNPLITRFSRLAWLYLDHRADPSR